MSKGVELFTGLILLVLVVIFYTDAYRDDRALQAKVKDAFAKKYPTYELLSSAIGDGDFDVVLTVHIEYKTGTSDSIHKEVWTYWHADEGWRNQEEQNRLIQDGSN